MRRRVWALALALVVLLSACGPGAVKEEPFIEEFLAMDTAMRLTVYGQGAGEAAGLARERVLELEALLSVTDENSDICAANRNGGGALHADTAALLEGHEPAWANFQAMPPSVQKIYTRAYLDAKTEAGREKRLAWMVDRLNRNLKPM